MHTLLSQSGNWRAAAACLAVVMLMVVVSAAFQADPSAVLIGP